MALSASQQQELNKAILSYFKTNGFEDAYTVFSKACDAVPEAKHESMLEKKWKSISRLQKKILDLEKDKNQLIEDLKNSGSGKKKDTSLTLPRDPAQFTLVGHRSVITSVVFHPVFNLLVTCGEDSTIKVWDYESGKYERSLQGHQDTVQDLAFNPKGTLLASCSADLSIKLWDFESYACVKTLQGHDHNVSCVRFFPTGDFLVSCSRDKKIKTWDVSTGFCARTMSGHEGWVRKVAISPDGSLIASCSADKSIRVWDAKTGKCVGELRDHDHVVESIAFSDAKSDHFIEKFYGGKAEIPVSGDLEEEEKEKDKEKENGHRENGKEKEASAGAGASVSGAGRYLLSGSRDKTIKLWDLAKGTVLRTFIGHDNWVRSALFHPSGQRVISCADDKTIRVWDLVRGREVRKIENAHELFVTCLDWNRGGIPLLASGGTDNVVKIWECRA